MSWYWWALLAVLLIVAIGYALKRNEGRSSK